MLGYKRKDGPKLLIDILKDLFYSTGRTLFSIFREPGSRTLDFETFRALVNPISDYTLSSDDLKSVFKHICPWKNDMNFTEFE